MPTVPLYMDRHDVPGATPDDLAAAHAQDVALQIEHGVTYVTYWHDPGRGAVFCLAEGPSREAVETVHREGHGLVANSVIEVDRRMVGAFLGAILEPEVGEPFVQTAFRAILFTDIAGSTDMNAKLGDARALAVLRAHDTIIRQSIADQGGSEVKHTGDGIMASFGSARSAVACALSVQRRMGEHNAKAPDPVHVRIGISAGEPVTEAGDLFGAAVQLAARVCSHCTPGTVLVTAAVRELSLGKSYAFEDRGEARLKGFTEPVRIYAVGDGEGPTRFGAESGG